jgi:hypothetical protein
MAKDTDNDASSRGTKKPRKTNNPLPTNRIAFAKQIDMLRAYGTAYVASNQPVTSAEIGRILDIAESTVPLATPFFIDVGLLNRVEGGYVPSQDVISFHHAREWNPDGAELKLQPALRDKWFWQALKTRLSFKGEMDATEAITILAEAANATKDHRFQLTLLLSYLEVTGLITHEGSIIRPVRGDQGATALQVVAAPAIAPVEPQPTWEMSRAVENRTTEQHLLDILDPGLMSDAEQDAVWLLLKYVKKLKSKAVPSD